MKNADFRKRQSLQRTMLLGSAATLSLFAVQAHAETYGPTGDFLEAQGSETILNYTAAEPQIVIADPNTPTTAVDPVDVNGVGQMIIDQQNGFLGLCTGTLINPRTVIFAAHCVNDRAATDYGSATGGTPIGFGFSNNNIPGLVDWYFGGHMTNEALAFYNANYVNYHPDSLDPDAFSFLFADVAVASLDTPAQDIPTWALMFSPLPVPEAIDDVTGTGYHVTITGYGSNGAGADGSIGGIDYRRRVAENIVGGLASLDQFENFLFGGDSTTYPQNLYWIDFDDPTREDIFDFNAWKDDGLPNEGGTAGGDSGGPLILDDTYDIPVVLGVLSGGYTRFFNGQGPNSYGTASFYQPLYLYWDWIVENNPYRYVSAVEGNGAWEDPEHWVTTLDPMYMVLDENGNLINGLPSLLGQGTSGNDGTFGQACFQWAFSGDDECLDMATGDYIVDGVVQDAGAGSISNNAATVSFGGVTMNPELAMQVGGEDSELLALPDPSIDNGLPGATGFVPNNSDGDRLTATPPRYFDVTLSATGTTTLSSEVTVDRFTLNGVGAALDITADGSLTSLMDINQWSGLMRVDGTLTTPGDYFIMAGGLQGSGTINAEYFTNVMGVIAPGGVGSIGTLTFNGNVILSSGSTYLVDIGDGGTSDLIAVNATTYMDTGEDTGEDIGSVEIVPVDGMASIGGSVVFGPVSGSMVREGDSFTILTAEGGVYGEFNDPAPISAILTPVLSYTDFDVTATLEAGLYADVINAGSPIQAAYAQLLDQNRVQYDQYADLYGPTDLLSIAGVQSTLESWAPREQPLMQAMGVAAVETGDRFVRERLATIADGSQGGTVAYYGRPGGALAGMGMSSLASLNTLAASAVDGPATVEEGKLPEDMSAFFAGGYINGKNDGAPTASPYAGDDFDGFYIAAGLEIAFDETAVGGVALSWTKMDGEPGYPGRSVKGNLFQVSGYVTKTFGTGVGVDAHFSAGTFDLEMARTVSSGAYSWDLRAKDQPFTFSGEVGLFDKLPVGTGFSVTPRIAMRYASIDFNRYSETGYGPALKYDMDQYESLQARGSLRLEGEGKFKPFVIGTLVHDFKDKPEGFGANFVGGVGPDALFALPTDDQTWGEIGAGIATTGKVSIGIRAETTVGRSDLNYQSYSGTVAIKF